VKGGNFRLAGRVENEKIAAAKKGDRGETSRKNQQGRGLRLRESS